VVLRAVRPTDKALLAAGFARLSAASRTRRFLAPKERLSRAELRYLTEVDGWNHVAIGAVITREGAEEGIGIGRFIRLEPGSHVAEAAIAVLDDYQGRGLGGILLARLIHAARERDVQRFACDVFADNRAMLDLLRGAGPSHLSIHEGIASIEVELGAEPHAAATVPEPLAEILRLASGGTLRVAPRPLG
jgi:GNAT superfamily N-acetyltransferase